MEVLVSQLEREAHQLEQDGDDIRAIRMMERALAQRITARMNGSIPAAERLVVKYNTVAVRCFKNDDFDAAQTLLNSALELTSDGSVIFLENDNSRVKLRGTTLNNFGCLERRRGNMPAAASYLKQSIEHAGQDSPASFLNLSAVLTNLGRYTDAVAWCRRAIAMLENNQHQDTLSGGGGGSATGENQNQQQLQKPKSSDAPGLMAIAYHNLASPLEQLDRAAAIAAYRKALEIARTEIGINSSTTRSIQMSLDRFLKMTPAQVTAAGSPGQQMQAAQQLAAASGDLAAATGTGKYGKSSAPLPSGFLPAVGGGSGAGSRVLPTHSFASTNNVGGPPLTARNKAAALVAARRKPDYMSANGSRTASYAPRHSQTSTPTGRTDSARPSPRKLSPLGERRNQDRDRVSTPPRFASDSRENNRNEIRERTAAKVAADREAKMRKEPMARSQERNSSRTPPPNNNGRRQKNFMDDEPLTNNNYNYNKEFAHTARNNNANNANNKTDDNNNKQQRPRSSEKQQSRQQPAPPKTDRKPSTANNNSNADNKRKSITGDGRKNNNAADENNNNNSNTSPSKKKRDNNIADDKASKSIRNVNNNERQFSRAPAAGSGSGNPVKDLEEEISKKDDIVSFMVARLAALLRAEEDFERCYIAVCRIQCLFRKVRATRRVQELRRNRQLAVTYRQVRENSAARRVVRFFRFLVIKRQEAVLQELREEEIRALNDVAAGKIQRCARMWLAGRELIRRRADARLHAKALRVLQCWFRKLLAQRLADRLRETKSTTEANKIYMERREFAAAQIQRIFLGRRDALKIHRIRRSMKMLREKEMESRRTSSAKRIQAAWRGCLGRRIARGLRNAAAILRAKIERWQLVQRAIKLIQAWTRGTVTRIRSAPELAVLRENQRVARNLYKNVAATKINSVVRGFLARRQTQRSIKERTAQRRHDWFVFLLPNVQAYFRGRISTVKVAKKFHVQLEREHRQQLEFMDQRGKLEEKLRASFGENVAAKEIEERKEIEKLCRGSWIHAHASDMKNAAEIEEILKRRAEAADKKRQEDIVLATAGPVNGERKRPGKIADELKIGNEKKVSELDEEDEDARRIFAAQEYRQQQAMVALREERAKNAPVRGPFYDNNNNKNNNGEGEDAETVREDTSKPKKTQLQIYNDNPQRGLSVPVRETIRKQELAKRTQDRLEALKDEEVERQKVLAGASGMRISADDAVSRTKDVLAEPMPQVEKTNACDQLPDNSNNKEEKPTVAAINDEQRRTFTKQSVQSPEKKHNDWEDFSVLDKYTAAHRDDVINAITRRSVSMIQAQLRARASAVFKATARHNKKPEAPIQKLHQKQEHQNEKPIIPQQQVPSAVETPINKASEKENAVKLIQSLLRTKNASKLVDLFSLAKFQERHYSCERIQAVVRGKQSKPQRIENIRREKLRRNADKNISEKSQDEQVRNYAAALIQHFLKNQSAKKKGAASPIMMQKKIDKQSRAAEAERSCNSLARAYAVKMIQAFVRIQLMRLRARKNREGVLRRCQQVVFGEAFEQEREVAARLMQAASKFFILRLRRRSKISSSSKRLYEMSNQLDQEKQYAAVKVQSAMRGALARKRRKILETEKTKKWAGILDEELERQQRNEEEVLQQQQQLGNNSNNDNNAAAATKIQCAFRSGAARQQAAELREQKKADWERIAKEEEVDRE